MRAAVTILAILIGLVVLWQTRFLVLLTLLGSLFGVAATPAVDWLERRHVRRPFGSPIVVGGAVLFVIGVGLWSGPTLVSEFSAFKQRMPVAVDQFDAYLAQNHGGILDAVLPHDSTAAAGDSTAKASARLRLAFEGQSGHIRTMLFGALSSSAVVLAGIVYVFFLTIYFAIEPLVYRRGLLLLVGEPSRNRYAHLADVIAATLRKWLSTQLIAMVVMGLVTTLALLILHVKSAIPLGILAGILEFVPNIGPIVSAVPAVLMAFAESPQKALIVLVVYWAIHFAESNLLIPYLMREELDLPPALTMACQAMMALLFGLLGLFIAVPLLAAVFVGVRYFYVRGDVPPVRNQPAARIIVASSDGPTPA